jgi:hypothetical protein
MDHGIIPCKLSAKLENLVRELESKAGRPICWKHVENLGGAMHSDVLEGCPIIEYRAFTEEGAAHELLHLHLAYDGFPRLLCEENMNRARRTMVMLQDTTHHLVLFPKLKEWGYDPCAEETKGIERQLEQFREEDFARISSEPDLRALYSMVYVRAWIESEDPKLQARVERIFADGPLQECRTLGKTIIKILRARNLSNNQEAYMTLSEAVQVLGQSDYIEVQYPSDLTPQAREKRV